MTSSSNPPFKTALLQLYMDGCRNNPNHLSLDTWLSMPITQTFPELVHRLIVHTRSVERGKGEWRTAYTILLRWASIHPNPDHVGRYVDCLRECIQHGSWKDLPYFAEYVLEETKQPHHVLILACIRLLNDQLDADSACAESNIRAISHASKWIPRETSRFRWLFYLLAVDWTDRHKPYYYLYARTPSQKESALKKSLGEYRQEVSRLSRYPFKQSGTRVVLDTLDHYIKQSVRILEEKRASESIADDISRSFALYGIQQRIFFLQHGWERYLRAVSKQSRMGRVLPIIDLSRSMYENNRFALWNAIGMACLVAYQTPIHERRVLTIDYHPCWIDLSACTDLVHMVDTILTCGRGNTLPRVDQTLSILKEAMIATSDPATLDVLICSNFAWIDDPSSVTALSDDFFPLRNTSLLLWKVAHASAHPSLPPALCTRHYLAMFSSVSAQLFFQIMERRYLYPSLRQGTPYDSVLQTLFAND